MTRTIDEIGREARENLARRNHASEYMQGIDRGVDDALAAGAAPRDVVARLEGLAAEVRRDAERGKAVAR